MHDAFISYSRKDVDFARRLEKALEDYKPPKDLKVAQRHLDVFVNQLPRTSERMHPNCFHLSSGRQMNQLTC